MRPVTLQQCWKCPPASLVTPGGVSLGHSSPDFWDAVAGVGTVLGPGANLSSSLSMTKIHL